MAWHQHFTPNETTRLHSPSHLDLHAGDRLLHPRVVLGAPMERLWDKLKHEVEERLVLASGVVRGRVEEGDEVDDVRVSQLAHELELAVLKWSCQVFGASDRGKRNVRRTMNLGSSPTCQKARQSKPKGICELSAFETGGGSFRALSPGVCPTDLLDGDLRPPLGAATIGDVVPWSRENNEERWGQGGGREPSQSRYSSLSLFRNGRVESRERETRTAGAGGGEERGKERRR